MLVALYLSKSNYYEWVKSWRDSTWERKKTGEKVEQASQESLAGAGEITRCSHCYALNASGVHHHLAETISFALSLMHVEHLYSKVQLN